MTSQEIQAVCSGVVNQVEGLLGISKLAQAAKEVAQREAVVATKEKKLPELQAAIAEHEEQFTSSTARTKTAKQTLDTLEAQVRDKEQFASARSAQLDTEIKQKSEALATIKASLASVHEATAKHVAG
jgi:chromosome segregation ATPase